MNTTDYRNAVRRLRDFIRLNGDAATPADVENYAAIVLRPTAEPGLVLDRALEATCDALAYFGTPAQVREFFGDSDVETLFLVSYEFRNAAGTTPYERIVPVPVKAGSKDTPRAVAKRLRYAAELDQSELVKVGPIAPATV